MPGEICQARSARECQGRSARGEPPGRYGRPGEWSAREGLPGPVFCFVFVLFCLFGCFFVCFAFVVFVLFAFCWFVLALGNWIALWTM